MPIRVAIIEDEELVRESLVILISNFENLECCFSFADANDALVKLKPGDVDVILVDINLPGKSGIDYIKDAIQVLSNTSFLICTSLDDTESIFKALEAGATGYLLKSDSPKKITESIEEIYNGGSPMSTLIARKVITSFHKFNSTNHELKKLSSREQEIVELLSKGLRYKEIAEQLFISAETVRTHIRNVYEKLQVNSRTEALNKLYKQ